MPSLDHYSDDDLRRLAAKTKGVQGGKDRYDAILAALEARGQAGDDEGLEARQSVLRGIVGDQSDDAAQD